MTCRRCLAKLTSAALGRVCEKKLRRRQTCCLLQLAGNSATLFVDEFGLRWNHFHIFVAPPALNPSRESARAPDKQSLRALMENRSCAVGLIYRLSMCTRQPVAGVNSRGGFGAVNSGLGCAARGRLALDGEKVGPIGLASTPTSLGTSRLLLRKSVTFGYLLSVTIERQQ